MDKLPHKMKVITPLGDEEFNIERNENQLIVSVFKGSVNLNIEKEYEDCVVASGNLNIPFDCTLTLIINGDKNFVEIKDNMLNETYLRCVCEVM